LLQLFLVSLCLVDLKGDFLPCRPKYTNLKLSLHFFVLFSAEKYQKAPLKKKGWLDLELCYLLNLKSFTIFPILPFQISAYFPSFAVVAYLPSTVINLLRRI